MDNNGNESGKNREMLQLAVAMILGAAIIAGAVLFLK